MPVTLILETEFNTNRILAQAGKERSNRDLHDAFWKRFSKHLIGILRVFAMLASGTDLSKAQPAFSITALELNFWKTSRIISNILIQCSLV